LAVANNGGGGKKRKLCQSEEVQIGQKKLQGAMVMECVWSKEGGGGRGWLEGGGGLVSPRECHIRVVQGGPEKKKESS